MSYVGEGPICSVRVLAPNLDRYMRGERESEQGPKIDQDLRCDPSQIRVNRGGHKIWVCDPRLPSGNSSVLTVIGGPSSGFPLDSVISGR